MAVSDAVKILVDGLTHRGTVYAAGQVVFDPPEELIACADAKRTNAEGELLCKRLSKSEALRAAKAADEGDEEQPVAEIPEPAEPMPEEDVSQESARSFSLRKKKGGEEGGKDS